MTLAERQVLEALRQRKKIIAEVRENTRTLSELEGSRARHKVLKNELKEFLQSP